MYSTSPLAMSPAHHHWSLPSVCRQPWRSCCTPHGSWKGRWPPEPSCARLHCDPPGRTAPAARSPAAPAARSCGQATSLRASPVTAHTGRSVQLRADMGAYLPRKWIEHSSFGIHHTTKWGPQSSHLCSHHLWKQALHLADSILDALQNTASSWKVLSSSLLRFSYLCSQVGGFFTSALKLVFLYPRCQAMVFLSVFSGWVFLRAQTLPLYLRLGFSYLCSEVGVFLPALKLEFSYLCSQIGVLLPLLSNWGSPSWGHPAEPHTPQREPASSAPPTGWGTPPLKLAAEAVDRNRKGRKKSHTHSFGLFASYATLCGIFRSPYLGKACYSSTMQKIQ